MHGTISLIQQYTYDVYKSIPSSIPPACGSNASITLVTGAKSQSNGRFIVGKSMKILPKWLLIWL